MYEVLALETRDLVLQYKFYDASLLVVTPISCKHEYMSILILI